MTLQDKTIQNGVSDAVVIEHHDDVALIRLNRPATRNALAVDIKTHLETRIPALMKDSTVRCLVITGTDESFCAGGDISNMADAQSSQHVRQRRDETAGRHAG